MPFMKRAPIVVVERENEMRHTEHQAQYWRDGLEETNASSRMELTPKLMRCRSRMNVIGNQDCAVRPTPNQICRRSGARTAPRVTVAVYS